VALQRGPRAVGRIRHEIAKFAYYENAISDAKKDTQAPGFCKSDCQRQPVTRTRRKWKGEAVGSLDFIGARGGMDVAQGAVGDDHIPVFVVGMAMAIGRSYWPVVATGHHFPKQSPFGLAV
jgi:hypothetical protein